MTVDTDTREPVVMDGAPSFLYVNAFFHEPEFTSPERLALSSENPIIDV